MREKRKPIIQIRNLRKVYRMGEEHVVALNRINLDIFPGEICCIFGTSGSGKSTLLNLLAGLEKPSYGQVLILGKDITRMREQELAVFHFDRRSGRPLSGRESRKDPGTGSHPPRLKEMFRFSERCMIKLHCLQVETIRTGDEHVYYIDKDYIHETMKQLTEQIGQIDGMKKTLYKGTERFNESSITYRIRYWTEPNGKRFDIRRAAIRIVQDGLKDAGIPFPYNHLDVELVSKKKDEKQYEKIQRLLGKCFVLYYSHR